MNEVKPCKCTEIKTHIIAFQKTDKLEPVKYRVWCAECYRQTKWYESMQEAIQSWNKGEAK
jgi:hypothetical protein